MKTDWKLVDISGKSFGRLVVLEYVGHKMWSCKCACGNDTTATGTQLRSGGKMSCGCLNRELYPFRSRTHGQSDTPEYRVWAAAKDRCCSTSDKQYADYGGRGIRMCDEWMRDFGAFMRHMGPRPQGLTLERLDNDGNYEPGNCVWADRFAQGRNKRNNVWIEIDGVTRTAAEWSRCSGVSKGTLHDRLKRGWEAKRAVFTQARHGVSA